MDFIWLLWSHNTVSGTIGYLVMGFRLVICGDGNMSLLCLKRHIVDYIEPMKT